MGGILLPLISLELLVLDVMGYAPYSFLGPVYFWVMHHTYLLLFWGRFLLENVGAYHRMLWDFQVLYYDDTYCAYFSSDTCELVVVTAFPLNSDSVIWSHIQASLDRFMLAPIKIGRFPLLM